MTDFFVEPEERDGLLQSWITTRADLNAAEQDNIDAGAAWAYRRRNKDPLSVDFAMALHKRMFDKVWSWAANGTYAPDETAVRLHHRLVFVHPFPNGNG